MNSGPFQDQEVVWTIETSFQCQGQRSWLGIEMLKGLALRDTKINKSIQAAFKYLINTPMNITWLKYYYDFIIIIYKLIFKNLITRTGIILKNNWCGSMKGGSQKLSWNLSKKIKNNFWLKSHRLPMRMGWMNSASCVSQVERMINKTVLKPTPLLWVAALNMHEYSEV